MTSRACCAAMAAIAMQAAVGGEAVKLRGIFVNDEDWNLRPWAVRHFGAEEGIGTNAYERIFALMHEDGLNLIWPAMHEGGYEFATRPENMALAARHGICVGSSHCEPMLRNNAYLTDAQKKSRIWDWTKHRDFIIDYWKESTGRYATNDVLWTVGMRGIHDQAMVGGTNRQHKIEILEDVFRTQYSMLPKDAPKLFCPYKEVLSLFNAGLKVPHENTTIMWVNDNYGYVRRLGGPQCEGYGGGIYYHIGYNGEPHGYLQLCTTPPALLWYELVQKCANNGARDVWMVNAGDVFQAEILLYAYGKFATDPDWWMTRNDPQGEVLAMWVRERLRVGDEKLAARIATHLNDYYNLGFIRKPEFMNIDWTRNLPESVKTELIVRYEAHLKEDQEIDKAISTTGDSWLVDEYFRTVGFQSQFLAQAGLIHLKGLSREYAQATMGALNVRFHAVHGGEWDGFWTDTVTERKYRWSIKDGNNWTSVMQWPWNEPKNEKLYIYKRNRDGRTTAYRANKQEPRWLEAASSQPKGGGEWKRIAGLGTSGGAYALLPVKPDAGVGATLDYDLPEGSVTLVVQFLPGFSLWPGLDAKVGVEFIGADGAVVSGEDVELPCSNSEASRAKRSPVVQDNFVRSRLPVLEGAVAIRLVGVTPGIVLDRVGVLSSETK